MRIAVEIRFTEEYRHFMYEIFKRITAQHPRHSFIFIFDGPSDASFIFSENVTAVVIKPQRLSLLQDMKISAALKKYQADVLITGKFLSQTRVPQCLIVLDKTTARSLSRANNAITDSEFSKKEIAAKYKIAAGKINVVYKGADEIFQPVTFEQKEKIKETYASGNEYFLYAGANAGNDLFALLKAFSSFKKMQKSSMQLLITAMAFDNDFLEKLGSFKYRDEVKVLRDVSEEQLAFITASSYAFVFPIQGDYVFPLAAMRSGVAAIVNNAGALPEVCGDAALVVNGEDIKDIAEKMTRLFKEEDLGSRLVEKGKQLVKKYSWDAAAKALWKMIEKTAI